MTDLLSILDRLLENPALFSVLVAVEIGVIILLIAITTRKNADTFNLAQRTLAETTRGADAKELRQEARDKITLEVLDGFQKGLNNSAATFVEQTILMTAMVKQLESAQSVTQSNRDAINKLGDDIQEQGEQTMGAFGALSDKIDELLIGFLKVQTAIGVVQESFGTPQESVRLIAIEGKLESIYQEILSLKEQKDETIEPVPTISVDVPDPDVHPVAPAESAGSDGSNGSPDAGGNS